MQRACCIHERKRHQRSPVQQRVRLLTGNDRENLYEVMEGDNVLWTRLKPHLKADSRVAKTASSPLMLCRWLHLYTYRHRMNTMTSRGMLCWRMRPQDGVRS